MSGVWWNQISRARHFVDGIQEALLRNRSVIVALPSPTPWYREFFDTIQDTLHREKGEKKLKEINCPTGQVGRYLLDSFCRSEKRFSYRIGITYARFLGESDDITLNDYYLWVKNVSREKLDEWVAFIDEYNSYGKDHSRAVFILEVTEEVLGGMTRRGLKTFSFRENIGAYDRFAFCALAVSDNVCKSAYRPYLAELVSNLCQEDVELCAKCVDRGGMFLKNPYGVLQETLNTQRRSDGSCFRMELGERQVQVKIWESQIRILFPIIEQYRRVFIEKRYQAIQEGLPIEDTMGNLYAEPYELEIGLLVSLIGRKKLSVTMEEYEELVSFKDARNLLAHLDVVPWENAERIIQWEGRQGNG